MRRGLKGAREPGPRAWRHALAVFLACCACALQAPAHATGTGDISPAERLIFMTDHLHGVRQESELDYALLSAQPPEQGSDTVRVLVVSPGNAKGDAQVSDHSGAVPLPNGGLACNPVIIYFLERDIADMERATGGKRRYFQQRVRLALAAGPKIETVTTQVGGKPVTAQQIVIQPYKDDPNAERFAQYTGKRYTFLIADTVPGQVALIRTEVPGANGDFAHPLQTRTLRFDTVVRKLPAPTGPNGPASPAKPPDAPRANR
ncbi:hypothetical protein [Paraburkholderia heleia]|uniref:hypothetical protein n=1 Tax=Paraburkholderia heleia TaxID=634127 RepID=UPI0031D5D6C0